MILLIVKGKKNRRIVFEPSNVGESCERFSITRAIRVDDFRNTHIFGPDS